MTLQEKIDQFFDGEPHAVVGASRSRVKYGNKVLRAYLQNERPVFPVNPRASEVEGLESFRNLESVPGLVHGVSIITPPDISRDIVDEASRLGIKNVWFQPGAESDEALERAEKAGMNIIAGGPCVLVTLRYREG